jgi:serine/threonine protein kinase
MNKEDPAEKLYDLKILKEISRGHFGVLYKAKTKKSDVVALKVIKNIDHHAIENSKKELFVYSNLPNHPNILKCYGYAETQDSVFILFEYISNKDLWENFFRNKNRDLSKKQIAKYIWQLCDALRFLHYYDIIHADVKLENILVDNDDDIRLCDFGLSKINHEDYTSNYRRGVCGTVGYIAPEIYEDELLGITPSIDSWAVGIVLYELLYRKNPFMHSYEIDNYKNKDGSLNKSMLKKAMSKFPDFPKDIDDDLYDLFKRVFRLDPEHRATLSEIQRHRWVCKYYKFR